MRALVLLLLVACLPLPRTNEQHLQRMCVDRNYAYESGYNAGLNRRNLDTSWVESYCAPERRDAIRSGYHAGYHEGMANAPVVVRGSYSHQHQVQSSSAPGCRFSSDCSDGQTCRSGTCMGNGWTGDACWFSSDCLSESCDGATRTCR